MIISAILPAQGETTANMHRVIAQAYTIQVQSADWSVKFTLKIYGFGPMVKGTASVEA